MSYVIYVEETSAGYLSFNTEQEANEWLELGSEVDLSDVKWTDQFNLKCSDPIAEDDAPWECHSANAKHDMNL